MAYNSWKGIFNQRYLTPAFLSLWETQTPFRLQRKWRNADSALQIVVPGRGKEKATPFQDVPSFVTGH